MELREILRLVVVMRPTYGWTCRHWEYRLRFLGQDPPTYNGKKRGLPAEGWLLRMQEIFEDYNISNNQLWIRLAALTHIDKTASQWKDVRNNYEVKKMTWETFREVFYTHHFNEANEREAN